MAVFNVVDFVNRFEAEGRPGRPGRMVDDFLRVDFIVLVSARRCG